MPSEYLLKRFIFDNNCDGFRRVETSSHRICYWYVDMSAHLKSVASKRQLASLMYRFCIDQGLRPNNFVGVPYGFMPVAEEINNLIDYVNPEDVPAYILRAETKLHGVEEGFAGEPPPGSHAVVLDDVVSTGGGLGSCIQKLQKRGVIVDAAAAILIRDERRDDGRTVEQYLSEEHGVPFFVALHARDILPESAVLRNPTQEYRDFVENYYRTFGIVEIKLPRAG